MNKYIGGKLIMSKEKKITIALWLIPVIIIGILVLVLPEQIPLHFNYKGDIDRSGSRYWVLLLIPIPYLIYVTRIKKKKN